MKRIIIYTKFGSKAYSLYILIALSAVVSLLVSLVIPIVNQRISDIIFFQNLFLDITLAPFLFLLIKRFYFNKDVECIDKFTITGASNKKIFLTKYLIIFLFDLIILLLFYYVIALVMFFSLSTDDVSIYYKNIWSSFLISLLAHHLFFTLTLCIKALWKGVRSYLLLIFKLLNTLIAFFCLFLIQNGPLNGDYSIKTLETPIEQNNKISVDNFLKYGKFIDNINYFVSRDDIHIFKDDLEINVGSSEWSLAKTDFINLVKGDLKQSNYQFYIYSKISDDNSAFYLSNPLIISDGSIRKFKIQLFTYKNDLEKVEKDKSLKIIIDKYKFNVKNEINFDYLEAVYKYFFSDTKSAELNKKDVQKYILSNIDYYNFAYQVNDCFVNYFKNHMIELSKDFKHYKNILKTLAYIYIPNGQHAARLSTIIDDSFINAEEAISSYLDFKNFTFKSAGNSVYAYSESNSAKVTSSVNVWYFSLEVLLTIISLHLLILLVNYIKYGKVCVSSF